MLTRFSWTTVLVAWSRVAAAQSPAPAPLASVAAVQLPAWIDRAGVRLPLAPGAELRAHDQVTTGAGSRLLQLLQQRCFPCRYGIGGLWIGTGRRRQHHGRS